MGTLAESVEAAGDLRQRSLGSLKWASGAVLIPRALSPLSTLLIATLLSPAEFGLAAAATVFVGLAQLVAGLGMGPALVQKRDWDHSAVSAAVWATAFLTLALYLLIYAAAPTIETLYKMPGLATVLRLAGVTVILTPLSSIPSAILQRRLDFAGQCGATAASQAVASFSSVALVLGGAGVNGLVAGPVLGAFFATALLWRRADWRPSFAFDWTAIRQLLGYGSWVTAAGVGSWLFLYGDNALAGYWYGSAGLGKYALSFNLANLAPGLVVSILSSVAFPAFCRLQDSPQRVAASLLRMHTYTAAIVFPVCAGLALISAGSGLTVLGAKWEGVNYLVGILAISPGVTHLFSLNSDAYRALNRPDAWPKLAALNLVLMFGCLLAVHPASLASFTLLRSVFGLLLPALNLFATAKLLQAPVSQQLRALRSPAASTVCMIAAAITAALLIDLAPSTNKLLSVSLPLILGTAVYAASLHRIDRPLWSELTLALRSL